MEGKVLFIDDEPAALSVYRQLMVRFLNDIKCLTAGNSAKAISILKSEQPEIVVLDLCLEKNSGAEGGFKLLREILQTDGSTRIIVLTGFSDEEYGIRAIQAGAASFLTKPVNNDHLQALILDGLKQSQLRRAYQKLQEHSRTYAAAKLLGNSKANQALIREVEFAAANLQPVLISGETGTGKGYISELIHELSSRKSQKYIAFQPILHSPEMVASELFGHIKGAFTGADNCRAGILREADGGTLFIDEVDALPLNVQVALLGVLQNKKYRTLGSDRDEFSDFRLISASNKNIEDCLSENKIRTDLYFRLAHVRIQLPALRNRLEDLPLLSSYFIDKFNQDRNSKIDKLSDDLIEKLQSYHWPGNIRELEAAIFSACSRAVFVKRSALRAEDFNLDFSKVLSKGFHRQVYCLKKDLIIAALKENNNSQLLAARQLGIDRGTLRRVLREIN